MAKKIKKGNGKANGRNKSLLGQNAIFTPEVIDDIHIKSELGRYRMRGMALMRKIPTPKLCFPCGFLITIVP